MQTNPIVKYGVHSIAAINRDNGLLYGMAKIIGSATLNLAGELTDLNGGSSPYPYSSQPGRITPELSLKLKEYPPWLTQLFAGATPTDTQTPSTSGEVSTLVNKKGTSVMNSTTGIASIGVKSGSEADVKFMKLIIKAVTPTTVDVFAVSDIDFLRGTDLTFKDDYGRITDTPLTIPDSGATVDIPGTGLELTGGSGTVAMTADDTAECEVYPKYSRKIESVVGSVNSIYPEFGLVIVGERVDSNQMSSLEVFKCKGLGLPHGFDEKAYGEPEIKVKVLYDSAKQAIYKERLVIAQ